MDKVINKISETAMKTYRYAAEATGKIARELKLKAQMANSKSQINDLYRNIGKNVYGKYILNDKKNMDEELLEDCSMIDILSDEVEDIRMELLNLKDLKQCPKCYFEIDLDYRYCPNCGYEQKMGDVSNQNDGPSTIVTTDESDSILKRKNVNYSDENIEKEQESENEQNVENQSEIDEQNLEDDE